MATDVDSPRSSPWAWGLCWLMFASTILNYMDRQAVTLVGEDIKREFGIANTSYGWVLAAFQLSYALFQVPAGFAADRRDVRWVYAAAVAWWSLAAAATALAPTLGLLMVFRGLLGVGEAFNWPCALRVTATVLPPADRPLGNGIFNSGAAVGAVVTPLLVAPLAVWLGWRSAFVVSGILGFVWIAAWLAVVMGARGRIFADAAAKRSRPESGLVGEGEDGPLSKLALWTFCALGIGSVGVASLYFKFGLSAIWIAIAVLMVGALVLARVLPESALRGAPWARSLGSVVRHHRFWVMAVVSVSINVCWHFLVNWLPTYLKTDRGMPFLTGSLLSAMPFAAADLGNLMGGTASRALARSGWAPARGRIVVIAACALLISSGGWVGGVRNNTVTMVLLALMAFGTAAFMANYFAFCQEISGRHTGLIVGILGGLGNLFAAGFSPIAGYVKDTTGSFGSIFAIVGLLPFTGLFTLALFWGRDERRPDPS